MIWKRINPEARDQGWSLLGNEKYEIWFGRWSPSHHTYIRSDLQPIFDPSFKNESKQITLEIPLGIARLTDLPSWWVIDEVLEDQS